MSCGLEVENRRGKWLPLPLRAFRAKAPEGGGPELWPPGSPMMEHLLTGSPLALPSCCLRCNSWTQVPSWSAIPCCETRHSLCCPCGRQDSPRSALWVPGCFPRVNFPLQGKAASRLFFPTSLQTPGALTYCLFQWWPSHPDPNVSVRDSQTWLPPSVDTCLSTMLGFLGL